jgi:hypothetical protein
VYPIPTTTDHKKSNNGNNCHDHKHIDFGVGHTLHTARLIYAHEARSVLDVNSTHGSAHHATRRHVARHERGVLEEAVGVEHVPLFA